MQSRVLVCAYFAVNTGDDLFLKVLFDRYPNVKWDLLTANRNYIKIFKEYKNVQILYTYREVKIGAKYYNIFFKLNDLILNFKKYDALINIGGSIFMQGSSWKKKLKERNYLVTKFKEMNKKIFIIGANFGPFNDEEFIQSYRELFKKCDDICFRDSESFNLFKELENVRLAPDIVFGLKSNERSEGKEKIAGFSIINLKNRKGLKDYYHLYNNKIIELAKNYLSKGYRVKLFSFCENEGDLNIIQDIESEINNQNIEIVNYKGDIDSFLEKFKSCEVILGTRFHSIILALKNRQKVVPIIYSEKTYNVLKDLNMQNDCHYIKDISTLNFDEVNLKSDFQNSILHQNIERESEIHFKEIDNFFGDSIGGGNFEEKFTICN
ncbi:polysaccharide pyruvyl transferase family protein [Rossellomorea vietnamensis]|uniref:polysaccharide pyruvyl transferase family protein n=1 Tax=Rossellomorea vietnamensis TaxID=218284 RepID=UPI000558A91D|nr:polysaccharide pyruvyl transferase family protein [Rossellomorea vietnamensis]